MNYRWMTFHFGEPNEHASKLECAISSDKKRVVLSERHGPAGPSGSVKCPHQVGMTRDEVIELLHILGREFVLDLMADL